MLSTSVGISTAHVSFIQQKLGPATSDEKEFNFNNIITHNALPLIQDVFGNQVIQKLFAHGTQIQKTASANTMDGHVLRIPLPMYWCHVVQRTNPLSPGNIFSQSDTLFLPDLGFRNIFP